MKLSALSANPQISPVRVFVLHWNRPAECVQTIWELKKQAIPLLIAVIDNGSSEDNLQELIRDLPSEVELLKLRRNLGWGQALNVALRNWMAENGEQFCVISAHDALPARDCLRLLCGAMLENSRLGIACPQHDGSKIVQLSAMKGIHLRTGSPGPNGSIQVVPAPHGTLMMVRRECLKEIGLFDERYFAYGDETEIGLRAAAAGWRTGLVWGALVSNPGTWTPHRLRAYLFSRNNILTVQLYLGPLAALVRVVATLFGCLNPYWWSSRGGVHLVQARVRGVVDFLFRRYGTPPSEYFRHD